MGDKFRTGLKYGVYHNELETPPFCMYVECSTSSNSEPTDKSCLEQRHLVSVIFQIFVQHLIPSPEPAASERRPL